MKASVKMSPSLPPMIGDPVLKRKSVCQNMSHQMTILHAIQKSISYYKKRTREKRTPTIRVDAKSTNAVNGRREMQQVCSNTAFNELLF
jgi:hypothetical protein